MKKLFLLLIIILTLTNCASQKTVDMMNVTIEYSAVSRGFFQKIKIENQIAQIQKGRDQKAIEEKIDDSKWNSIVSEFQKLNLDSLSTLKAPTEKRFYDGAAIGMLTIIKDGKTYQTNGFDHGTPPKEIEKIINQLLGFTKE